MKDRDMSEGGRSDVLLKGRGSIIWRKQAGKCYVCMITTLSPYLPYLPI